MVIRLACQWHGRRGDTPGWNFQLALEILQSLNQDRSGKSLDTLSKELRVDSLQLDAPLQTLIQLDWLGKLDEAGASRYVLLVNPAKTLLAQLCERLLLPSKKSTDKVW